MLRKLLVAAAFAVMPLFAVAGPLTINLDVFQILQSSVGDPFPETVLINFNNPYAAPVHGSITIKAEGVDMSENDSVFLNGNFLGLLTHQTYNYCCFNLQPGPGDLGFGQTESLDSFFDVFVELQPGLNTIQINIDPGNWIVEIETVQITLPESGTLLLLSLGLGLIGWATRRRQA